MKFFLSSCAVLSVAATVAFAQQTGTPQSAILTQQRSPATTTTPTGTGVGTATSGTGTVGSSTVGTSTTTGTGTAVGNSANQTFPGTGVTPTTAGPTPGSGTGGIVSGAAGASTTGANQVDVGSQLPLQNTTNIFGQVVGVQSNQAIDNSTNTPSPSAAAYINRAGGQFGANNAAAGTTTASSLNAGSGGLVGTTVAQQSALGINAPGFTQITVTLQGTVQSEADRQAILNRFQGIQGFQVLDQLQVAGQGNTLNEAAGANNQNTTTP